MGSGFGSGFEGFNFGGFGGFGGFDDILSSIFGGTRRGTRTTGKTRGADLRTSVTITFEEAAFGAEKELAINKYETCTECSGLGAESRADIEICPKCHGRGRVLHEQNSLSAESRRKLRVRIAAAPVKSSRTNARPATVKAASERRRA